MFSSQKSNSPSLRPLPKNGTIAVTAPASNPPEDKLNRGIHYLESLGYRVSVGKTCYSSDTYLAGSAKMRADEFMTFMTDPNVDAVFCARGGFGSMQILKMLDYPRLLQSRKLFVGFSDITAMQWAIYSECGLPSISAGMVATDMAHMEIDKEFESNFWKLLHTGEIAYPLDSASTKDFNLTGNVLAGTVSVAAKLLGSEFFPDTTNCILVLEDVLEPKHKVEGYLDQFELSGIFEKSKAVILGTFSPALTEEYPVVPDFDRLFDRVFENIKIPVFRNFGYGHVRNKISLPVGVPLCLSSDTTLQLKTIGSIFDS